MTSDFFRIDAVATKDTVKMIVEDTGIGIPDEEQENVFRPFYRLEPQNYYGLGLGLTVVYEIVKLGGGSIEIESAKGKGTKFIMSLPVQGPPKSARAALKVRHGSIPVDLVKNCRVRQTNYIL